MMNANRLVPPVLLGLLLAQHIVGWLPIDQIRSIYDIRLQRYPIDPLLILNWPSIQFLSALVIAIPVAYLVFRREAGISETGDYTAHPIAYWALIAGLLPQAMSFVWSRAISFFAPSDITALNSAFYALSMALALFFKLGASFALFHALKFFNVTRTFDGVVTTEVQAEHTTVSLYFRFRTTIALAFAIYPLLPLYDYVVHIGACIFPSLFLALTVTHSGSGHQVYYAGTLLFSFGLAHALLRAFLSNGIAFLTADNWATNTAYRLFVTYIVLSPIAIVLTSIPYGGGYIPNVLKLLLSAAQLFGILSLYKMLLQTDPTNHSTGPARKAAQAG